MNKSGGAILCRNLQCPVGIQWVAGGAGQFGVGHPVGLRRAARRVFYEQFCVSVLLRVREETHQQWWWSDFVS